MATPRTKAPSTAAPPPSEINPLAEGLARVTGGDPLSTSTGTEMPIGYENFTPVGGDVVNITSSPGSGATQAETWAHDIALQNLQRQQLQFAYQQQQDFITNAVRAQQAQMAAAAEARAAGLYSSQLEAANLAAQMARADLATKQYEAQQRAKAEATQAAANRQVAFQGPYAVSPQSVAAFQTAKPGEVYRPNLDPWAGLIQPQLRKTI
jgi:hypothetical protein